MSNHNPDMSGLKPFKKGQSGNPGGKTSAHRKAEVEAAELAAFVSRDLVAAVANVIRAADNDAEKLEQLRSDTLALLRDVQNRAHGTPKQTIEQDVTQRTTPKGLDAFYDAIDGADSDETGES